VHSVFQTPGQIVTQWLELPDGQRFFSIARTVAAGGGRHDRPRVFRAIALACAAENAADLCYVQDAQAQGAQPTPIGVTCRLCNRATCTARSAPPIGREILLDDSQRSAEPFTFTGS
jgi:predicted transcriptional regulator